MRCGESPRPSTSRSPPQRSPTSTPNPCSRALPLWTAYPLGIHSVDWNCDGFLHPSSVSKNLDVDIDWCAQGGDASILADYDDWDNLVDSTDAPDVYNDVTVHRTQDCMTRQEFDALRAGVDSLNDPLLCWDGFGPPPLTIDP